MLIVYGLYLENCSAQLVFIVEVEDQSSVLKSAVAGVVPEMKGTKVEASFKQLAARQWHGAWTTDTSDGRVYEREIMCDNKISVKFVKADRNICNMTQA